MDKGVMHDPIVLALKSDKATTDDLQVARGLLDTLAADKEVRVDMAANTIGACKKIIVFDNGNAYMTMINSPVFKSSGLYVITEGCLFLQGGIPSVEALSDYQEPTKKCVAPNPR